MTYNRSTARDTLRDAVLEALDTAATQIFGEATNGARYGIGAIDADLPELFKALDAQLDRLADRYVEEPAADELTDLIYEPHAGCSTIELRAGSKSYEIARINADLGIQRLLADGHDQVTAISWVHRHNQPNRLPALVSNSCGLSVWTLDDDRRPVERAVNIHG